ncbi:MULTISPECIES: NETI motif-containing protein [Exiguobacterium]|uniref:NETI motif-containing protein n=1 Tax=Exiguobacterium oxidotolerans TaxID=223958 RepID=A0A653I3P1_9BACL|nr:MULTISPECIES: NETI motif-containing protein [Exiguobacterium]ASI34435.1 NETI motif-containing protein [Exiguobacterium sp. N4-1P]VWX33581.1 NETI motif-containing protein [Exiguobacterium oxidotolerans]
MAKKQKLRVAVEENETISDCLDRIDAMGYRPTVRREEPIFGLDANEEPYPIRQQIIFDCKAKTESD